MPFRSSFDAVYAVIQNAVRDAGGSAIHCQRVDEILRPGSIPDKIIRELRTADLCIADLTGRRANVMWEVGYAMSREIPLIQVIRLRQPVPFNISGYHHIAYDLSNLTVTLRAPLEMMVRNVIAQASTDSEVLDYLRRTIPLRDRPETRRRFQENGGLIVSLLLKHHLDRYNTAVEEARKNKLPLASGPRLEVATLAINEAESEIRAITDLVNDQWQKPGSLYLEANRAAAERGVKVRRIALVTGDPGAIPRERYEAVDAHRRAGALVEYAYREQLQSRFRMTGDDFTPQNMLIVDRTLMTLSNVSNSDGQIIVSESDIDEAIVLFDRLWDHVCLSPTPDPRVRASKGSGLAVPMTDVAVVGAGPVGTNAAIFLSRLGFEVKLLEAASAILQGGPRASFINHGDGFEYYKSGHRRTGEYCIDGALVKGLLYPLHLFATSVCSADNPIRFFVSRGSVAAGDLTLEHFLENAESMRRHFARQYDAIRVSRGWTAEEMERRFLRTPTTFARQLDPHEYADVAGVVGGCAGSSFGINMPQYYAYLMAALARTGVAFRGSDEPVVIERVNGHYRLETEDGGVITARQILLTAGHRNPALIHRIRGIETAPLPSGTYYLNAMTFVRLPATEDAARRANARRINFTLQQEHGAMFACIVPPTAHQDGIAAIYRPDTRGSQLYTHTVADGDTSLPPPEWKRFLTEGLENDEPHVHETFRRARELYPVLENAEILHTICRTVFNASTADSNHGRDRRVREIPPAVAAVVSDGSITVWTSPKWTNAELVALMACDNVHEHLRGTRLPHDGASRLGPTGLDLAALSRRLELMDLVMSRDDALRYAHEQRLPPSVVDVSNPWFK
jgi:glycine/D-amino acid oxidase-like deaminating enzyme